MLKISNLRTEKSNGWIKVICDVDGFDKIKPPINKKTNITFIGNTNIEEKTMWFALKEENSDLLNTDTYDAFILVPYYMGMFFGEDLVVYGKVSKKLYYNLTNYVQRIFLDYSDYTRKIHFDVDELVDTNFRGDIIGAGLTCGVDSLQSIYERYKIEADSNYRINRLFFFNCGSHGNYGDPITREIWLNRYDMIKKASNEIGLPLILLDSNIHAFANIVGQESIGYLSNYSCMLAIQKKVYRYYTATDYEYGQMMEFGLAKRDCDLSEYGGGC